jgi:hypothetical protein
LEIDNKSGFILQATAEANNLAAVARSKAVYMKEMEEVGLGIDDTKFQILLLKFLQICGSDTPFMTSAELREQHNRCQTNAVQLFNTAKKMGGPELADNFRTRLLEDIQVRAGHWGLLEKEIQAFAFRMPLNHLCESTTPRTCSSR